jgi:hypothetical protein
MSVSPSPRICCAFAALLLASSIVRAQGGAASSPQRSYLGFDRNQYPGDANLPALRKNFQFTSYWLNNPPGAQQNSWAGKRSLLKANGFGFVVLFNGRNYEELKGKNPSALGAEDGKAAVAAAIHEGFARNTLLFLDQEQGGRLLSEQAEYLFAWVDAVRAAGARAGIYCSAIDVPEGKATINTARDILEKEKARSKGGSISNPIKLWIANDQCPPAPGCTLNHPPIRTAVPEGLRDSTLIWQYAQSPRRNEFTRGCPGNYDADNNCYAPGMTHSPDTFIDLNVSVSPNPSESQ